MKRVNARGLPYAVWFACGGRIRHDAWYLGPESLPTRPFVRMFPLGELSKKDRIDMGHPMGTHAMLMTRRRQPTAALEGGEFRGETEGGHNGYYTMNDNLYHDYVFEIVAPEEYLTEQMKEAVNTEPIVLPAWDPMCKASRRRV